MLVRLLFFLQEPLRSCWGRASTGPSISGLWAALLLKCCWGTHFSLALITTTWSVAHSVSLQRATNRSISALTSLCGYLLTTFVFCSQMRHIVSVVNMPPAHLLRDGMWTAVFFSETPYLQPRQWILKVTLLWPLPCATHCIGSNRANELLSSLSQNLRRDCLPTATAHSPSTS